MQLTGLRPPPLWHRYARLANIPGNYQLSGVAPSNKAKLLKRPPPKLMGLLAAATKPDAGAATGGVIKSTASRSLLQLPQTCFTQGLLFDQTSPTTATAITYTGTGFTVGGVPLVQTPGSKTLILSSNPACTTPTGSIFTLQAAKICAPPGRTA
jgi:hypothetical protein